MKELQGNLYIEKDRCLKRWNIIVVRNYIDRFGKPYSEKKVFDDFASEEIAKKEYDKIKVQAINCGYKL